MIFQSDDYARSLEDLTESELRVEELRVYSMLEYDMNKRVEDRDGWHGFACESAKKLLLVRWALEHLGLEPTLFGCEREAEGSSEEVEDVVLIAA
ncbi:hypothetical protein [Corynebacterium glyciniphilum]|uniref:hypothetical protein n=1 Tax=Corynebacterium glyciniphilum TaxID=1404244 RepID=UPI00264EDDA8|nr:hypothetical protein [Corynebacterium glyciniphilum]MDN5684009.1 hypothetical protein [Corynebacterium glyciniphilum]MDN6706936.1 hypothetical protein [Corynebacterium glyciniphilum]